VATQNCNGGAVQNGDYSAANASSEAATTSKKAFVSAWNPVATTYAVRPVQEKDI
jgi:hypothetical protein